MNDIEMLFEDLPKKKVGAKLKVAKTDPLQGVSSWAILRELLNRHYVDLQVVGFWVVLAVIIYVKLGR